MSCGAAPLPLSRVQRAVDLSYEGERVAAEATPRHLDHALHGRAGDDGIDGATAVAEHVTARHLRAIALPAATAPLPDHRWQRYDDNGHRLDLDEHVGVLQPAHEERRAGGQRGEVALVGLVDRPPCR